MDAVCRVCEGAGRRQVRWNGRPVVVRCHGCAGRGKVAGGSRPRGAVGKRSR
jgi:hypothetical protein